MADKAPTTSDFPADCGVLTCTCTNSNFPNSVGRPGVANSVAGGTGGGRGDAGCGCTRVDSVPDGGTGNPGASGACGIDGGSAGDPVGTFQGARWVPGSGGQGGGGSAGSGGGGGGSGGMSAYTDFSSSQLYPGLPGGGGGGGGCGGPGGFGGIQGGASIALVLVNSTVSGVPDQNSFVPGPGGAGGWANAGGVGGQGGPGSPRTGRSHDPSGQTDRLFGEGAGLGWRRWTKAGRVAPEAGARRAAAGRRSASRWLEGRLSPQGPRWAFYAGLPGAPGQAGNGGRNPPPQPIDPNPCTGVGGSNATLKAQAPAILIFNQRSPRAFAVAGSTAATAAKSLFTERRHRPRHAGTATCA